MSALLLVSTSSSAAKEDVAIGMLERKLSLYYLFQVPPQLVKCHHHHVCSLQALSVLVLLQQTNRSRGQADSATNDAEMRDNRNCHLFWQSFNT